MKPQVYHVDAFTSQPFRGNSAGVVFPADNLSEAQMQLIARELGHSKLLFCCTATTAMCASATLRQRLKRQFAVTRRWLRTMYVQRY